MCVGMCVGGYVDVGICVCIHVYVCVCVCVGMPGCWRYRQAQVRRKLVHDRTGKSRLLPTRVTETLFADDAAGFLHH